jgi:hypothetical protein
VSNRALQFSIDIERGEYTFEHKGKFYTLPIATSPHRAAIEAMIAKYGSTEKPPSNTLLVDAARGIFLNPFLKGVASRKRLHVPAGSFAKPYNKKWVFRKTAKVRGGHASNSALGLEIKKLEKEFKVSSGLRRAERVARAKIAKVKGKTTKKGQTTIEKVLALAAAGKQPKDIAHIVGISLRRVQQILKSHQAK